MATSRLGHSGFGVSSLGGDFSGRLEVRDPFTRLGHAGYGVHRAGSFGGKTEDTDPPSGGVFNYTIFSRKRGRR